MVSGFSGAVAKHNYDSHKDDNAGVANDAMKTMMIIVIIFLVLDIALVLWIFIRIIPKIKKEQRILAVILTLISPIIFLLCYGVGVFDKVEKLK